MFEEEYKKHINEIVRKRYEDAKFYLDILIENGVINKSDENVKKLFVDWFSQNKEFDLQIEDGDIAIENGDLKVVPDFRKDDIVEFVNWYNKEKDDFIKYLNDNGISIKQQSSIQHQKIEAENIVINNGQIQAIRQTSKPEAKKDRWDIVTILGLVIAILTFIFGDNIIERFDNKKSNLEKKDSVTFVAYSDTIQIPYLKSEPILDKGLFLQHHFAELIFGGANIDSLKISSRKENGEKIKIKKDDNGDIILEIFQQPYIEFFYKNYYYSLKVRTDDFGNSFICIIQRIKKPTLNLIEVKNI